jgi:hypothetical protein
MTVAEYKKHPTPKICSSSPKKIKERTRGGNSYKLLINISIIEEQL